MTSIRNRCWRRPTWAPRDPRPNRSFPTSILPWCGVRADRRSPMRIDSGVVEPFDFAAVGARQLTSGARVLEVRIQSPPSASPTNSGSAAFERHPRGDAFATGDNGPLAQDRPKLGFRCAERARHMAVDLALAYCDVSERHCQLSRPWYARCVGGAAARVGRSFARLFCCPLKPSGAAKRRPGSAKLTMPAPIIFGRESQIGFDGACQLT